MSDAGTRRPCRVEIRTATIRIPGVLGLLLAIPVLFVFGAIALACLVAGLTAMTIAPWLLRRAGPEAGHEEPSAEDAVTLDRTAYRTVDEAGEPRPALPWLARPHTPTGTRRPPSS